MYIFFSFKWIYFLFYPGYFKNGYLQLFPFFEWTCIQFFIISLNIIGCNIIFFRKAIQGFFSLYFVCFIRDQVLLFFILCSIYNPQCILKSNTFLFHGFLSNCSLLYRR